MLKKFCRKQGCQRFADEGFCEEHRSEVNARDQYRGTSYQRGYTNKWRKARLSYLKKNPLCHDCTTIGRIVAANEVHHITAHRGNMKLFWDSNNWMGLCKSCHSTRTAKGE